MARSLRAPFWSLVRHWVIQLTKTRSLVWEHTVGWLRALGWIPFLVTGVISKKWRPSDSLRAASNQNPGLALPVLYINLAHRKDRNRETLLELRAAGLSNFSRLDATANALGALGCAQSHVAALEGLEATGEPVALVCEDDIEFVADSDLLELVLADFMSRPGLGVLCLSYRLRGPAFPVSRNLALANNLQTTAGYVVKESALEALQRSFRSSRDLLAEGEAVSAASIDIRWKSVQFREVSFCIPRVPIARQRRSHSDIAGRMKFYG